ncbi:hypothetical protein N7478_012107 [Penicillium angulare]|uniref:uncharacterized protein n=1 Tax=Penicillium angulare TaxID=116970 RepID=UPI00254243AE|nr:uncharacterized protein N7478_012107 [Penicillium angulare]KAJ5260502.1 hypothetical protein N7478_012107 [Penicillium angulare]
MSTENKDIKKVDLPGQACWSEHYPLGKVEYQCYSKQGVGISFGSPTSSTSVNNFWRLSSNR